MASKRAAKAPSKATYKVECFDGMNSKVVKRNLSSAEARKLAVSLGKKFSKYVYEVSREAPKAPTKARKARKR